MIRWYASRAHYAAHLAPIRAAMGAEGTWHGPNHAVGSQDGWDGRRWPPKDDTPVIVASAVDAQAFPDRPVIYVEHGAGQAYHGDENAAENPSYAGGSGLDNVIGFICPRWEVADRWKAVYPNADTWVVNGCPRLDQHHATVGRPERYPLRVAFTWHWDCMVCPETRTAWPHWRPQVQAVLTNPSRGVTFGVHAHPRAPQVLQSMAMWNNQRRVFTDVDRMLDWCDVLIADNTSVLYEAAALGRRVVTVDAPWYRSDVHHGLRFWDAIPGLHVTPSEPLRGAVETMRDNRTVGSLEARRAALGAYGGIVDGSASQRAAAGVRAILRDRVGWA